MSSNIWGAGLFLGTLGVIMLLGFSFYATGITTTGWIAAVSMVLIGVPLILFGRKRL